MVTSAENRRWPDDLEITDHVEAGLPSPSVICPVKIATVEARNVEVIGRVPMPLREATIASVVGFLSQ